MWYPQNREQSVGDKIHRAFLLLSTLTRTFRNLPATLFGTFLSQDLVGSIVGTFPQNLKPFSLPPQTLIFFGKLARDQWPFMRALAGNLFEPPRINLEPCWKPLETRPRTFPEPGQSQALDWFRYHSAGEIYSTWWTRKYSIGVLTCPIHSGFVGWLLKIPSCHANGSSYLVCEVAHVITWVMGLMFFQYTNWWSVLCMWQQGVITLKDKDGPCLQNHSARLCNLWTHHECKIPAALRAVYVNGSGTWRALTEHVDLIGIVLCKP